MDKSGKDIGVRYLLVDEFQDMAAARATMLLGVLRNCPGSKLFGVGDDWQAINGFAGSELRLMTRFHDVFGPGTTQQLTRTFRSNQGIASVASRFVMRNSEQLKKDVIALDKHEENVIEIHLMDLDSLEDELLLVFEHVLDLAKGMAKPDRKTQVYALARYNSYKGDGSPKPYEEVHMRGTKWLTEQGKEFLDLSFHSFHGSKGLEADIAILMGLVDPKVCRRSFPSRMPEDELVELPLPVKESFPDAVERRLMYVALTRARHKVILPVPAKGASVFIEELMAYGKQVRVFHRGQEAESCPVCGKGTLARKGRFVRCSNLECDLGVEGRKVKCPQCGTGNLVVTEWPEGFKVHCRIFKPECGHVDWDETNRLRQLV